MSIAHSVIPLEDRLREDDVLVWLGHPIPDDVKNGRYPTPNELRAVLDALSPYSVNYEEAPYQWIAVVSNEYPVLTVEAIAFSGNPNQSQEFRFTGDRAILTRILQSLPESCGTFLVTTDGEDPEFVMSGNESP